MRRHLFVPLIVELGCDLFRCSQVQRLAEEKVEFAWLLLCRSNRDGAVCVIL